MDRLSVAWVSLSDLSVNISVVCILMRCGFSWDPDFGISLFSNGLIPIF